MSVLESFEVDCADYSLSRDLESKAAAGSKSASLTGCKARLQGFVGYKTDSASFSSVDSGVVSASATRGQELSIPDSTLPMIVSGRRRVNHLVELKTRRQGSDFYRYIWPQVQSQPLVAKLFD